MRQPRRATQPDGRIEPLTLLPRCRAARSELPATPAVTVHLPPSHLSRPSLAMGGLVVDWLLLALLVIAFVANLLMRPVHEKHHYEGDPSKA